MTKSTILLSCIELYGDATGLIQNTDSFFNVVKKCSENTPMRYLNPSYNEDKNLNLNLKDHQIKEIASITSKFFHITMNLKEGFDFAEYSAQKDYVIEEVGKIIDTIEHSEL